ncbi:alpha/beta hydrolase [Rhodopseudomonas palustris]|uniref:alpha/beta hydrolase n=1 Tax=Rhodopseudomonas palustris TaxID=1076 RepID=UPI002ACE0AEC|nr:alpha/beta hydrolase [Rhodopseudomonas palustris]WQG97571.1 alpha/beta hydrolase [Rhodopseudomonas palustris]
MLRRSLDLLFFSLVMAASCFAFAQVGRAQPFAPEKPLAYYIAALQSSNATTLKQITTSEQYDSILKETNGTAGYPILQRLGSIVTTKISSTVAFSDFTSYKAEVVHVEGTSLWQFRLDDTGKLIARAVLLQSNVSSISPLKDPGKVLGDVASIIRDPGRMMLGKFGSGTSSPVIIGSAIRPMAVPNSTTSWLNDAIAPNEAGLASGNAGFSAVQRPCETLPSLCGALSNELERIVEFIFATDRQPIASQKVVAFSGDRQSKLTFGAASVRVPEDHKFGRLELPSVWHLFGYEVHREKEKDRSHFTIKQLSFLSESDLAKLIAEQGPKSALVFVHGFNTNFEQAVYRNAQIVWDLQYRGLSVLFSWSTKGGDDISDYGYDQVSALSGRFRFVELVSKLQKEFGIKHINVIAHSMGNFLVLDALQNFAQSSSEIRLDQLVMAAPDIDRKAFVDAIPRLKEIALGMTLYASAADKALRLSAMLAKSPRAGDVPPEGPVVLPNLDTIDVTNIGDEMFGLNHTVFATNREIINDIKLLIEDGKKSPRLADIRRAPDPPAPPTYWKYLK